MTLLHVRTQGLMLQSLWLSRSGCVFPSLLLWLLLRIHVVINSRAQDRFGWSTWFYIIWAQWWSLSCWFNVLYIVPGIYSTLLFLNVRKTNLTWLQMLHCVSFPPIPDQHLVMILDTESFWGFLLCQTPRCWRKWNLLVSRVDRACSGTCTLKFGEFGGRINSFVLPLVIPAQFLWCFKVQCPS